MNRFAVPNVSLFLFAAVATASSVAQAMLLTSTPVLDFSKVVPGQSKTLSVTVTNHNSVKVTLTASVQQLQPTYGFSTPTASLVLGAGASATLQVTAAPKVGLPSAEYGGTLLLAANGQTASVWLEEAAVYPAIVYATQTQSKAVNIYKQVLPPTMGMPQLIETFSGTAPIAHLATCDWNNTGVQNVVVGLGNTTEATTSFYGLIHKTIPSMGVVMVDSDNIFTPFFSQDAPYVACADVTGDGQPEMIVAGHDGHGASSFVTQVRIFDHNLQLISEYTPYVGYKGAVSLAVGDVDGDGRNDVITCPAQSGAPAAVHAYSQASGNLITNYTAFPGFMGGASIAAIDVLNNGRAQIVETTLTNNDAVWITNPQNNVAFWGAYALPDLFPNPVTASGIAVAPAGDVNGDGIQDIAVNLGGASWISWRILSGRTAQTLYQGGPASSVVRLSSPAIAYMAP